MVMKTLTTATLLSLLMMAACGGGNLGYLPASPTASQLALEESGYKGVVTEERSGADAPLTVSSGEPVKPLTQPPQPRITPPPSDAGTNTGGPTSGPSRS